MKNKIQFSIYTFLTLCLLTFGTQFAYAQTDEYAKDKAERAERRTKNKADNEVNSAVDKEVDKAFNKIKGLFKKKPKKEEEEEQDTKEEQLGGSEPQSTNNEKEEQKIEDKETQNQNLDEIQVPGFETITLDKIYEFTQAYKYSTSYVNKKGKTETQYFELKLPSNNEPKYMAMSSDETNERSLVIFDHELHSMLMLADEQTGTIIKFEAIQDFVDQENLEEGYDVTITASGNTGVYEGRDYVEYNFDSPDNYGVIWVNKSEKANVFKLFVNMGSSMSKNGPSVSSQFEKINGLILKSIMTSKEDRSTTEMQLKDIVKIDQTVSTRGISFIDMSKLAGSYR